MTNNSDRGGVQRPSPEELLLVRDERTVRSVKMITDGDHREVLVSRRFSAASEEEQVSIFEGHAAEIQDACDGVTRCAFCEKHSGEVSTLIAGPTVHICNECVAVCAGILEEE